MTDSYQTEPLPVATDAEPSVSAAKTVQGDSELDPKQNIGAMEQVLLEVFGPYMREELPMEPLVSEAVKALLELKGEKGHKLVFLRYDLFQIFGMMNKKLTGADRL